jgi:hypothetical protein
MLAVLLVLKCLPLLRKELDIGLVPDRTVWCMYRVDYLKSLLAERIFLFGGLQLENTLVLRPGINFDIECRRFNGISLSGLLWQFLNILSFYGWCLGMLLLPRKRCALGVTRVLPCASFVLLVRKIEITFFFSGVASAGVFGGVLWLIVWY